METAGYSGTPLIKKLGIQQEMRVLLLNAPPDYSKLLGIDLTNQLVTSGRIDFVHLFAVDYAELDKIFHQLIPKLSPSTVLWISWYKKSSKIPTDISEDRIRKMVLPMGWVDVKVCAVSDSWSGLKIVKRISQR